MRDRLGKLLDHINNHPLISAHAEERKAPYVGALRFLRTYSEDIPGFENLTVSEVLKVFKDLESELLRKGWANE